MKSAFLPASYSSSSRSLPNRPTMETPKSMPLATRPRISEPCKPAASIRGLPRLFSSTSVPSSARHNPVKRLRFFINILPAWMLASRHCDRNGASVPRERGMRP